MRNGPIPDRSSMDDLILRSARSVESLALAVLPQALVGRQVAETRRAQERGYFRPEEDDHLRLTFSHFLIARAGLLETIDELKPIARGRDAVDDIQQLRAFIIAYTAACLLVRAGRFMVEETAPRRTVRRKLDEASPEFGIPRKTFTRLYRSLTDPRNGLALHAASRFAADHVDEIERAADDPIVGGLVPVLREAENAIDFRRRRMVAGRFRYRFYSWKRRHRSAFKQTMFGLFEASGRVIAEMRNPLHRKRITPMVIDQIGELLAPGDVIITRHDDAMSNLFLPGFWPHTSLHIGGPETIAQLGIAIDDDRRARWVDPICMLEARKDGVLFRPLAETLAVDACVVIRPQVDRAGIGCALSRALRHEGKLYDFEFDFTRADRIVCSELVYRSYDGVGAMRMTLTPRAGRMTCSAEDILDLAISGNGFSPVAVFGVVGCQDRLVHDDRVNAILAKNYDHRSDV